MDYLIAVALVTGLALAIRLLPWAPSWLGRLAERAERLRRADEGEQPPTVEWGLLSQSFVLRRLDALADELRRLDGDPEVFAKAFHTMVVRSAHEALLAEASRIAHRPSRVATEAFDVEVATSTVPREVLEL